MVKNFTSSLLKAAALSAVVLGAAFSAQAEETKLYLADVYTEAELNADIFGVPMRIDNVGGSKYVAKYFNQKANNEVYILGSKTDFSEVYGLDGNDLSMGSSLAEVSPIILPEAGAYYQIDIDTDLMTCSVSTYEVADYMDPVLWDLGSFNLNNWFAYVPEEGDNFVCKEDSWMREFYFGYTCDEFLINDNNEYVDNAGNVVMYDKEAGIDERVKATKVNPAGAEVQADRLAWCEPWTQAANNKHLYTWTSPKHFVAGQKLNFIVHNWHENGWWNFVTWRVDDENECDIFSYYGAIVKQKYLDYVYGEGKADFNKWRDAFNGEGDYHGDTYRKELIYGPGKDDCWCKPTVQTTGEYIFQFDTHLGRGKLVPASAIDVPEPGSVTSAIADENAPVEYFNLQGVRVNNPQNGLYIRRQGKSAKKVVL